MNESFDYGTNEIIENVSAFKNPEEGEHSARLRNLIHCGMFRESYKNDIKRACPEVVAVFELKDEEDFEDDGITPLTISKNFALKKGELAFMTKLLKALDPKGKAEGFDDIIGAACTINCKGSKEKNDDGTPKFINFGGIAGIPAKFAKLTEDLNVVGFGHVRFEDLTKEIIMDLHPIREVANIIMKGEKYKGSKAEEIINEIKKEKPDFAESKETDKREETSQAQEEVKTDLEEEQEF